MAPPVLSRAIAEKIVNAVQHRLDQGDKGAIASAARILKIPRQTVQSRLDAAAREYGIKPAVMFLAACIWFLPLLDD